jgi:hypothetical protein
MAGRIYRSIYIGAYIYRSIYIGAYICVSRNLSPLSWAGAPGTRAHASQGKACGC